VSVALNNGDGTFSAASNIDSGLLYPSALAVADLTGDGKPDLAVAQEATGTNKYRCPGLVTVLVGNGNGTFQTTGGAPYSAGYNSLAAVAGDFNGDGKPDLAVANWGNSASATLSVFLDNKAGSGSFGNAVNYGTGSGTKPLAVAVGDVNGDGFPDLITADYLTNTISILLNNGNGTFQSPSTFSTGSGSGPDALAVADINDDGKLDLAIACYSASTVQVLLGNGNGTFALSSTLSTTAGGNGLPTNPSAVALVDVNNDCTPDVIVTLIGTFQGSVNLNHVVNVFLDGSGGYQTPNVYNVGNGPAGLTLADVNGDGLPDLITSNVGSNTVSVLLSSVLNPGNFGNAMNFSTGASTRPASVAVGQLTGGGLDLVTADDISSGQVSVLVGNGNGTFHAPVNFATGSHARSVVVGDFNHDGKPDLAVATNAGNSVSVLLNNGSGNGSASFQNAVNYSVGTAPSSLAIGDFNRDTVQDLVTANAFNGTGGNTASVLLGNGSSPAAATRPFGNDPSLPTLTPFTLPGEALLPKAGVRIQAVAGDDQTTHFPSADLGPVDDETLPWGAANLDAYFSQLYSPWPFMRHLKYRGAPHLNDFDLPWGLLSVP
jgi:hypothetical protein